MFIDQPNRPYNRHQADFVVAEVSRQAREALRTAVAIVEQRADRSKDAMIRHCLTQVAKDIASIQVEIAKRIHLNGNDGPCLAHSLAQELRTSHTSYSSRVNIIGTPRAEPGVKPSPMGNFIFCTFVNEVVRDMLGSLPETARIAIRLTQVGQTIYLDFIGTCGSSEQDVLASAAHPSRMRILIAALGGHFAPITGGISFQIPSEALTNSPELNIRATSRSADRPRCSQR